MTEERDMVHEREWQAAATRRRTEPRRDDHDGAWEVAKRVVAARSAHAAEPRSLLHLQRVAGNGGVGSLVADDEEAARSPVLDVVGKGGGRPLPENVRADMESGLGADFGSVRVHDDAAAAASAHAVQAKAYTVGDDIVFNHGVYAPDTEAGRHTLAHELSHVVQQRSGPVDGTPTGDGVSVSDPGDRFEREAEERAKTFSAGRQAPATETGSPAVQRLEEDEDLQMSPVQREGEMPEEEEEEEAPIG